MKGSTHLMIGVALGAAAAAHYPFSLKNASLYIAISAFSALAADLDGKSLLNSKIGQVSKWLRELMYWSGLLMIVVLIYSFVTSHTIDFKFSTAALSIFLLGLVTKEGIIRNALVSLIGAGLAFAGWKYSMTWLIGFGSFIAVAPWMKHRGMTHTIWAVGIWSMIGSGLEDQLNIEGIMLVATVGYLSHLVADTLTPAGVRWLYPLMKKPIKIPFKTRL
ncbi:metal-dependent hydrolase [Paenibacillus pini]|uniref:Membrane-bound metal-dependent hydrolase YdjM n=1 Tax=Paenibacillus pini JCM 16418 TaxID=1236976 RepID=W7YGG5_9BACL|nr:metal-dependent hydrolase [Paenibacillus pini]GAF06638.1 hypothetical protein JCM16418_609 [Paenibacillus pini JCM 16418]